MNRRTFIEQTAIGGAAFSALPLLSSLSRASPYRTALVGSGWWGTNILRCAIQGGGVKSGRPV